MEKVMKLSWGEVIKWLVLVAGIATTYGVMQTKVSELERGRDENRHNIELLSERMRVQEIQISRINEKLEIIGQDVTVIKNAILDNSLRPNQ